MNGGGRAMRLMSLALTAAILSCGGSTKKEQAEVGEVAGDIADVEDVSDDGSGRIDIISDRVELLDTFTPDLLPDGTDVPPADTGKEDLDPELTPDLVDAVEDAAPDIEPDLVEPDEVEQEVDLVVPPTPCFGDADCEELEYVCDPGQGLCVQCLFDVQCTANHYCIDFACAASDGCLSDEDCAEKEGKLLCDVETKMCVACLESSDCPESHECIDAVCVPFKACGSSKDCFADQICWHDMGKCVGCLTNKDCLEGEECTKGLVCVATIACESDKQCQAVGMVCDKGSGLCRECVSNVDCPSIYHCKEGECVLDLCPPGDLCQGNAIVSCNTVGDGYENPQPCAENQTCTGNWPEPVCMDHVCVPSSTWCDEEASDVAVACSSDGLSILSQTDCTLDGGVCIDGSCLPQICIPGTSWCHEDQFQLVQCVGKGELTTVVSCPGGTYCKEAEGALTASCVPQVCVPDLPYCIGDSVAVCNSIGSDHLPELVDCTLQGQVCMVGQCKTCDLTEICDGIDNNCNGVIDENPTDCTGGVDKAICFKGKCYSSPNPSKCSVYEYSGHIYLHCFAMNQNWNTAKAGCAAWNGSTLIVINDQAEQDFLRSKTTASTWIGYTDAVVEGQFVWEACCSTFTLWCNNQPNDYNNQDCTAANANNTGAVGCWGDYACTQNYPDYFCEVHL